MCGIPDALTCVVISLCLWDEFSNLTVKCFCFCYVTPIHLVGLICQHLVRRVSVNIYRPGSVSGVSLVCAVFLAQWVSPHLVSCLYVVLAALGFV